MIVLLDFFRFYGGGGGGGGLMRTEILISLVI